jgi:anti-anti-sigma regulatory factor
LPARNKTTTKKNVPAVRKKRAVRRKSTPAKSKAGDTRVKHAAEKTPPVHTLTLGSVVVINDAKALYEELSKVNDTDVNIDASGVEMVDTAILQLLYAFVMKITSDNHRINWVNPSEEFIARTNLLGLSRIMGIA